MLSLVDLIHATSNAVASDVVKSPKGSGVHTVLLKYSVEIVHTPSD